MSAFFRYQRQVLPELREGIEMEITKADKAARDIVARPDLKWPGYVTEVANALIELTTPVEIKPMEHWEDPVPVCSCDTQVMNGMAHCPGCGRRIEWKS